MTTADHEEFGRALELLGAAFRQELTHELTAAYWLALEDLPLDVVLRGMRAALQRSTFFPRPAELRGAAGVGVPDAGLIEAILYAHLREPGGERRQVADPFVRLVVDRLGGMHGVSNMSSADRLNAIARILPSLIAAATVRGLPMPSEFGIEHVGADRLRLVKAE